MRHLLTTIIVVALLAGCTRWAIRSDMEFWDCAESECSARIRLENPYDAKIVVTTYVVAYQEEGLTRDTGAPYVTGGFEDTADLQDVEVGRVESQHILEANESVQVIENLTVTQPPDKITLIVSEARSIVE